MRILFSFLFCVFALPQLMTAHQIDSVDLELLQYDDQWKLEGQLDIAYMLPEIRGVEGAEPLNRDDVMAYSEAQRLHITTEAEKTMRRILRLSFAGKALDWRIEFPDFKKNPLVLPEELSNIAYMRTVISVDAQKSPGTFEAAWEDDQESSLIVIIEEGIDIDTLIINKGKPRTLLTVKPSASGQKISKPSKTTQISSWLISGFYHVIPLGLDHILFILGLFLFMPKFKPLLVQSLLFTFAHSVTLALAVLGVVHLPIGPVEILIAASIAWIGIENVFVKTAKKSRFYFVFIFGLLHGLGFASVLGEKLENISGAQVILPLISFNIGVELAQVSLLIAASLLIFPVIRYKARIQKYASLLIAVTGTYWMVERIYTTYFTF